MTIHRQSRPNHRNLPGRCLRTFAAAALVIALGACDDETSLTPNRPVEEKLQQILDRGVAKPGVVLPGAIAHYHAAAHRPWSGAAGLADVPGGVAMRPQDTFRAGSVLKTFLATVTLQHVEKGTLALEQKLPALLPAAVTSRVANADQITLRMLLNHTSGIPDWVTDDVHGRVAAEPGRLWSSDEAIDIASRLPSTVAPGAGWSYSNTNYTLVGLVLDRVGGKSWRAQVRERILDRLSLRDTRLPEPGERMVAGARGYHPVNGSMLDLSAVDPSMAGAAGGHALITTAQDLGRFLEALLAGELFVNPGTLAAMKTMVEAPHESGLPHRYGLGLEEFTQADGTTVIGHGGSTAGYGVMMFRLPSRDATLVTAVNTTNLFVNALEVFLPAVGVVASDGK